MWNQEIWDFWLREFLISQLFRIRPVCGDCFLVDGFNVPVDIGSSRWFVHLPGWIHSKISTKYSDLRSSFLLYAMREYAQQPLHSSSSRGSKCYRKHEEQLEHRQGTGRAAIQGSTSIHETDQHQKWDQHSGETVVRPTSLPRLQTSAQTVHYGSQEPLPLRIVSVY